MVKWACENMPITYVDQSMKNAKRLIWPPRQSPAPSLVAVLFLNKLTSQLWHVSCNRKKSDQKTRKLIMKATYIRGT